MADWNRVYAKVRELTRRRARWDAALALLAALLSAYVGHHLRYLHRGQWLATLIVAASVGVFALDRVYRAWFGWRCVAMLLDVRVLARSPPLSRGEAGRAVGGLRLTLDVREAFWLTPTGRGARVGVQVGHRDFRAGHLAWSEVREGMASSVVLLPSGTVLCRADSYNGATD